MIDLFKEIKTIHSIEFNLCLIIKKILNEYLQKKIQNGFKPSNKKKVKMNSSKIVINRIKRFLDKEKNS